jgi:hypothetical protein
MLNCKFLRFHTVVATVFMIACGSFSGSIARADDQGLQVGQYSTITGNAVFEQHHTLLPLAICDDGQACAQTRSYWMLVIQSGHSRYEINQPFGKGSEVAPDSFVLNEIVVRQGSRLRMDAKVDVVSRDYAILSDVRNVNVIMDMATPFFGWTCKSVGESAPIYVDIAQIEHNGNYSMRILSAAGSEDHTVQTVAAFKDVQLSMSDEAIDFAASTQRVVAELAIDQRGGRVSNLDSVLKISNTMTRADQVSLETTVHLSCNRTR